MMADETGSVNTPVERGLTCAALRETRHAHGCAQGLAHEPIAIAVRVTYGGEAFKERGEKGGRSEKEWIAARVADSETDSIEKDQKDARRRVHDDRYSFLLCTVTVTGPSLTSSTFIIARNSPVPTLSSPRIARQASMNDVYIRSACAGGAASM